MITFRTILRRHGITTITIGITLIAIALSLGITWSVHALLNAGPLREDLAVAVIAPLVIVPLISFQILQALYHLDQAEQQLRVLSYTDELTQVYNRRYFTQYVGQEFKRAQRFGETFSIAILDLDNFKQINDQFGHFAGDYVLQTMTRILTKSIRQADILARYGGDEFIFLFPRTNRQQILAWLARIHEASAETLITLDGLQIRPLFSVGVTDYDPSIASVDELLKQADDSLYRAKRKGGNQLVHYQD